MPTPCLLPGNGRCNIQIRYRPQHYIRYRIPVNLPVLSNRGKMALFVALLIADLTAWASPWVLKDISYPQPYSQLPTFMTLLQRPHSKWFLSTITNQLKMASRQAHKRHTEQTHILFMGISSIIQASGVTYNIQSNYNYMLTKSRLLDAYKSCLVSPEHWTFGCVEWIFMKL